MPKGDDYDLMSKFRGRQGKLCLIEDAPPLGRSDTSHLPRGIHSPIHSEINFHSCIYGGQRESFTDGKHILIDNICHLWGPTIILYQELDNTLKGFTW